MHEDAHLEAQYEDRHEEGYCPEEAAERRYFDGHDPSYVNDLHGYNLEGEGDDYYDDEGGW